jgi:insulysin
MTVLINNELVSFESIISDSTALSTAVASDSDKESDIPSTKNIIDEHIKLPPLGGKISSTWFKQDIHWKVPKLSVLILLKSAYATCSPLANALTELFAMVLSESLTESSYYADCAGLSSDISLSKDGIEIKLRGYFHKLPVLAEKVATEARFIASGGGSDGKILDIFNRLKEKLLENFHNHLFWQPYSHAMFGSSWCLEDPRWTQSMKYHALVPATFQEFLLFSIQFFRTMAVDVLVHGNASVAEAVGLTAIVLSCLQIHPLPSSLQRPRRIVQLSPGIKYIYRQHSYHFNKDEVNSAIENIYIGEEIAGLGTLPTVSSSSSIHHKAIIFEAILNLIAHLLREPAFDQLRTKEQLGYIVHVGIKKVRHKP